MRFPAPRVGDVDHSTLVLDDGGIAVPPVPGQYQDSGATRAARGKATGEFRGNRLEGLYTSSAVPVFSITASIALFGLGSTVRVIAPTGGHGAAPTGGDHLLLGPAGSGNPLSASGGWQG